MLRVWANAPSLNKEYYLKYLSEDSYPYDKFQDGIACNVDDLLVFESTLSLDEVSNIPVQPNYIGLPVISYELIEQIKKLMSCDFQEIPVVINCKDDVVEGYALLNILKVDHLIDVDNSDVTFFSKKMGGGVSDIEDYHTLDDDMPMSAFVREADYLSNLYVHPTVAVFLIKKELEYIHLPFVNELFD